MKKRILSIILSVALCVSAVSALSINTCSAISRGTGKVLPTETSITLGVNEPYKQTLTVDAGDGDYMYAWTSDVRKLPNLPLMNKAPTVKYRVSNKKVYLPLIPRQTGYFEVLCSTYNKTCWSDKDSCLKIRVKKAPTSVKLSATNLTLGIGEKFTISENTNSGSYANADNLKWSTSNPNVVIPAKVVGSNKAVVRAKGVGTATIKIKTYNGKTATCRVTVKPAPKSVKLSRSSLNLIKGMRCTISETTNSGSYAQSFTWSSSNSKVATVTKCSGNKAIVKAVGKGTAYIKIKTYNGKTATCKVTVK